MFYKIKNVKPLPDLILSVEFVSGEQKIYDVKPLLKKWDAFNDLKNEYLFNRELF